MGLDQKGTAVFCVKAGRAGQWNVLEEGFEKPLASFDQQGDAIDYAQGLADTKEGSKVRIYDQDGRENDTAGTGSSGPPSKRGDL